MKTHSFNTPHNTISIFTKIKKPIVLVNLLFASLFLYLLAPPDSSIITTTATTEIWSLTVFKDTPFPSSLSGIFEPLSKESNCDSTNPPKITFPTTAPSTIELIFTSIDNKNFTMTIYPQVDEQTQPQKPYAYFLCDQTKIQLRDPEILIRKVDKDRITILGNGLLTAGRVPSNSPNTQPQMLLTGDVTAASISNRFQSGRIESKTSLMLGDQIRFYNGDTQIPSNVIAIYDTTTSTFKLTTYSDAEYALINQFGTPQGYPIISRPPLLARLQAQTGWTLALTVLTILANFATLRPTKQ